MCIRDRGDTAGGASCREGTEGNSTTGGTRRRVRITGRSCQPVERMPLQLLTVNVSEYVFTILNQSVVFINKNTLDLNKSYLGEINWIRCLLLKIITI